MKKTSLILLVLLSIVGTSGCKKYKAMKKFNAYVDKARPHLKSSQSDLVAYEKWMQGYNKSIHSEFKKRIPDYIKKMDRYISTIESIKVEDPEVIKFKKMHIKMLSAQRSAFKEHLRLVNGGQPPLLNESVKKFMAEYRETAKELQKARGKYKDKYGLKDK
ncbi:MAG: hypothetical protein JXR95_03560 [Deltaproteobacteria bacterium]|nr:hypothetical protein [Deltaproteobacteria bacterium]